MRGITAAFGGAAMLLLASEGAAAESASKFNVKQDIVYAERGEVELLLDAYLPAGEEHRPGVLVVHGGAWRSGAKDQLAFYARLLAERGYAAFAINYRLAPEHKFPSQIEDCHAALDWLVRHADEFQIDVDRLGAVGYSAGGQLVALLGVESATSNRSAKLKAIAAGGAPCDFRDSPADSDGLAFWLGESRANAPDVYRDASPAAFVTADCPPMFFFHGDDDELVRLESPRRMVEALTAVGVESSLHVVPGAGHIAAAANEEALRRTMEFFDRHFAPPPDGK